jgi:hypothetical protein
MKKVLGRLLLVLLPVLLLFAAAEWLLGRQAPDLRSTLWSEALGDYPMRDQLMRDWAACMAESPLVYYEYWLFGGGAYTSATVNTTAFYGSRRVPASAGPGAGDMTVWMFGGSALVDIGTTDDDSIANRVALGLRARGRNPTVVNLGGRSFNTSIELIKFQDILRRTAPAERPNLVVFYDGYNDAYQGFFFGPGNLQGDISRKLEAVVTRRMGLFTAMKASERLSQHSRLWERIVDRRLAQRWVWREPTGTYDERLQEIAAIFEANWRMVRATCEAYNIRPLFILQPTLSTKTPLTEFEQRATVTEGATMRKLLPELYALLRERHAGRTDFADFSALMNGRTENDFYDSCHTTPWASCYIGDKMAELVAGP